MYNTFDSQAVNDEQKGKMDSIRLAFKIVCSEVLSLCPPGRERSECVTNLEYACMRAIRAITHTPVLEANGAQNVSQIAGASMGGCCKGEETGPCPQ